MGFLRLFLALSVIAGHSGTTIFGFAGVNAWYAVNFFFIISGFYMAMVINEKYKDIGPFVFYKSRLLRLFPTYYIGLTIAIAVSFGAIVSNFSLLTPLSKVYYIFQNLFILGQDLSYVFCSNVSDGGCAQPASMTINPPAWSLSVELWFYLVAPFILTSVKRTYVFVAIGCLYLLLLNFISFPIQSGDLLGATESYAFNYYFYPSSFIFFGGGALSYHLSKRNVEPSYTAALLMLGALSFTVTTMPFWHLLFFGMAIPVLFQYTKTNRVDRIIGELSYPAYILHFPILTFFRKLSFSFPQFFEVLSIGTWTALMSCALGLIVYFFVDKKVDDYRHSSSFFSSNHSAQTKGSLLFPKVLVCLHFLIPICVLGVLYSSNFKSPFYNYIPPFNLTDDNWIAGVSKTGSAFIVEETIDNRKIYVVGKIVKFSNGLERTVIGVSKSDRLLNVYFDGPSLGGSNVGYPNFIETKK